MQRKCSIFPVVAALLSVFLVTSLSAQSNLEKAMKFKPRQKGIEIDNPKDLSKCEIKAISNADGKRGWAVTNANGQLIRRFVDHNDDGALDALSFYRSGIEVYRDIDTDFDKKFDQYRWFGTAGMRWGIDKDQDGKVDQWKAISAEEVSLEVVEAIKSGDLDRYANLLITEDEVDALGVGEDQKSEILERMGKAKESFVAFARKQRLVNRDTRWIHFSGLIPGVIPAGTNGSTADVKIYDSVAAVVSNGTRSSGQLSIGTLIQVDDKWRVVDLPEPIVEGQALVNGGLFFRDSGNAAMAQMANNLPSGGVSKEDQKLFEEYQEIDTKIQSASPRELPDLNKKRASLFADLIKRADTDENRSTWVRQMADAVTASYQQGEWDGGIRFMQTWLKDTKAVKGVDKTDIVYCQYRVITSYYSRKMQDATTEEVEKAQDEFMGKLEQFVEANPADENSADAMIRLAMDDEAVGNVNDAKDWYQQIVENFPKSEVVRRARGANMRLNSEGRIIPFTGKSLDGRQYDLADDRGNVVLIQYWATWCESCKDDLRLIKKAHEEYGRRGFDVVSVSLDYDVKDLRDYLRKNPLPWTQLFEEGNLDSPLSEQLGIAMVPTMILVGADGKVLDRNVLAQDLDRLLTRQFNRSAKRDKK